jgi:hypothetical protein
VRVCHAQGPAFVEGHHWDVSVEYCKAGEQDILCRIRVENASTDRTEEIHVLPHMFFRNNWSWGYAVPKPSMRQVGVGAAVEACVCINVRLLITMRVWCRRAARASRQTSRIWARCSTGRERALGRPVR